MTRRPYSGASALGTKPNAAAIAAPVAAPGSGEARKHPRLAIGGRGDTLLVWTDGTAWARGGAPLLNAIY